MAEGGIRGEVFGITVVMRIRRRHRIGCASSATAAWASVLLRGGSVRLWHSTSPVAELGDLSRFANPRQLTADSIS